MDNENETRPLLHSFQSETWRSRARKKCMRIPSEITITGIILGLFLIVVTLLIVLENMESDKKQKNISLNDHLLASPMKYNKKADDESWQDKKDYTKFKNKQMEEKNKKWDKVNKGWKQHPDIPASPLQLSIQKDPIWQNKRDYYMKLKQDRVAAKWDKVNKGWKKFPDILASSKKFDKKEDPLWQDKRDYYMKLKDEKVEEKNRKWDKVNKGWKKLPDISAGDIHDGYEEKQNNLNGDIETMLITDGLDQYGKEVDDSFEAFATLRMTDPSDMIKFRQQVIEVKNLLHSNINWRIVDDGWNALSEQGWREHDIRRALMMALNEKRQELKQAQLENMLQSPMNVNDVWDQINDSWKKNLYGGNEDVDYQKIKGTDEAGLHLKINDEWRKKMDMLQSPASDTKKFVKEDEGWQKLAYQGWKNKDIEEKLLKAWKDQKNEMHSPQAPLNIQDLWVKATDFLRNLFNKGMNNQKSQMETNDEWAKKFNFLQSSYKKKKDNDEKKDKHSKDVWKDKNSDESDEEVEETEEEPQELQMNFDDFSNIIQALKDRQKGKDDQKSQMEINDEFMNILQSSYKKWKKNKDYKKKHPKDEMKDNSTDEIENDNDQLQNSPVNFEDFIEVIEAIREKGKKEAEKQKNINDEMKKEMGTLYSSKPTDKRWKQIDDHFKTLIEYERNTFFGRKDGDDTTSSPGDISLQNSMPFIYGKQDKMSKEWHKVPNQNLKEKDLKEAVYNAWKEGDKLRNSAFGHSDYKWKKINNGWKTISNKS